MTPYRPIKTRRKPKDSVLNALEDFDPVLARVYAARGIAAPADLDHSLSKLAPVSSLNGIADAVELLRGEGCKLLEFNLERPGLERALLERFERARDEHADRRGAARR